MSEPPAATAADAGRNLDTFTLRVSLAPAGEGKFHPKFSLYHVLLYVPNLRLEPPANGPDGEPVEAHARISKEQAKKIVDALAGFDFFKDESAFADPRKARLQLMQAPNWPHVGIAVRFQNGEDASWVERRLAWLPSMLPPLDAVRRCVDGDAAKALDRLLTQLADDRKTWAPDPLAEDLKKLQGSWAVEPPTGIQPLGTIPAHPTTAKCVIEGANITFKPVVQLNPLLDLETIRGTFELSAGTPRRMTIKGVRDTVSKQEAGTWEALYEVSDTTLRLVVARAGAAPPAGWKATAEQGERGFTLKRVTAGAASEWGEASNQLQARIRTPKAKYVAGEVLTFDLDVRDLHAGIAGKPWHWLAPRVGQIARAEVDGVWYRAPEIAFKKLAAHPLQFGEMVESWATVRLIDDYWIREGDEEAGGRKLILQPGKHRVRISYDFHANEGGHTARPVSGPLEVEVAAAVGRAPGPAAAGWKSKASWTPHGPGGVRFLGTAGDKHLYTAHKSGVVQWDMSGPEPKAENKVDYIIDGLQVAGIDRDGYPLLLRRVNHQRPGGTVAELTVLQLWDMAENLPPTVTVQADDLRAWAVSSDGKTLAVMGYAWDSVRLIDVESRKERRLDAPKAGERPALPQALMFTRDGKRLIGLGSNDYPVSGWKNGLVVCWDVESGKVLWQAAEADGQGVGALSRNGLTLVTTGRLADVLTVWDVTTGKKRTTAPVRSSSAVAVSPDGRWVVVGDHAPGAGREPVLKVWDLGWDSPVAETIPVPAAVQHISFAEDGRAFATANQKGEVRWWSR